MQPLTEKQRRILTFIEKRLANGNPPSQREIADHFSLSQNAVYQFITYLRKKGYLDDSPGHRNLKLSRRYRRQTEKTAGIPIVGAVAAGAPILAQQNIEAHLDPSQLLGHNDDTFMLRVIGDSMVDEGIIDGDLVAVQPTQEIPTGQIAVVMLDDEATVKRLYIQKNRIALKSANRAKRYKTRYIKTTEKQIHIIGKVIACLRTNIK